MAYGTKTFSRRVTAILEAARIAEDLAPDIGKVLAARFRRVLQPGEMLPDTSLFVKLLARNLGHLGHRLDAFHQRHHHALAVEKHARQKLREAASKLRDTLVDVRYVFDIHFGKRQGVADFEGREDLQRLPQHSLGRIAAGLLAVMDDEKFGWSQFRDPEVAAEVRKKLVKSLERYRQELEAHREANTDRENAAAISARGFKEANHRIQEIFASLFEILHGAGFADHAARLRPKRLPPVRRRLLAGKTTPETVN
jgi:hypothetical protein